MQAVIYHNPKRSTPRKTLELLHALGIQPVLIERPFVVTARGARLARPVDTVRETR